MSEDQVQIDPNVEFVRRLTHDQLMRAAMALRVVMTLNSRFMFFLVFDNKPKPAAVANEINRRAYIRGDEVRRQIRAVSN